MKDNELLIRTLSLLDWDIGQLESELNRESGEQKVSRSTLYRWLSGESPVHPGVKAFLREKLSNTGIRPPRQPRTKTTVLMVGPAGAGRTPLAYELCALANNLGVGSKVFEAAPDTHQFWLGVARGEPSGLFITADSLEVETDLLLVDGPDVRNFVDFAADDFALTERGKQLFDRADAVLIVGEPGGLRMHAFAGLAEYSRKAAKPILAVMGLRPLDFLPVEDWAEIRRAGASIASYHLTDRSDTVELFKKCLSGQQTSGDVTTSIRQLTEWFLEELGWEGAWSNAALPTEVANPSLVDVVQQFEAGRRVNWTYSRSSENRDPVPTLE